MPSYRIELEVGGLRHGSTPGEVMDAAVAACDPHHVDATDLDILAGIPRILVRFSVPASGAAEEDARARETAQRIRTAVAGTATAGRHRLLRRRRGSWVPLDVFGGRQ